MYHKVKNIKRRTMYLDVDNMYMIINDKPINDDFVTTMKWEDLQEFTDERFMIYNYSIYKVNVTSRDQYNQVLIAYMRNLRRNSARVHFPFKEKITLEDVNFSTDDKLSEILFDLMADGHEINMKTNEITMQDNISLNEDVRYLVDTYGFNIKIVESVKESV